MVKVISIIGFLSLAFAFNANAHDGDRVDQMQREIQEINLRLLKLESVLSNPNSAQQYVTSSEGWKSVKNWRKLETGMSTSDVEIILGEPHRVDGGVIAHWYYQNGGEVSFFNGKVNRWQEPRQ